MKSALLAIALAAVFFVSAVAARNDDVFDHSDFLLEDESENEIPSDFSIEDLQEMAMKVDVAIKAAGADRYRAPPIVPRANMDEFARELDRIKKSLKSLVDKLEPLLAKDKAAIEKLKAALKKEEEKARALRKKIRSIKRGDKKEDSKEFKDKKAALEKKINGLTLAKKWLTEVETQVKGLKNSAPGLTNYESILADVKKTLAENAVTAEKITNIDIVSELQMLDAPRADFDEDTASDLEISNVKMFETKRLNDLVARMKKNLDKAIDKEKKALKKLHEKKVPAHLHLGLRDAEKKIKDLRKKLEAAKKKFKKDHREDIPKLKAAKAELLKIGKIEGHIYHQKPKDE